MSTRNWISDGQSHKKSSAGSALGLADDRQNMCDKATRLRTCAKKPRLKCAYKDRVPWMAVAVCLLLGGCGDSHRADRLRGTWVFQTNGVKVTMTFATDHTCVQTMSGGVNHTNSWRWTVEGKRLIVESDRWVDTNEIVKLNDTILVVRPEPNGQQGKQSSEITFSRVK